MGGMANERETDPGRFRPLDGARSRIHDRDRAETVAAVNDQGRAAIMHKPRLRFGIDLAGRQQLHITRQPRHAVAIAAAQVGPDQAFRHDRGILRARRA